MKLFLDTNVIIDYILEREDGYEQSLQILSCGMDGSAETLVSSLTLVNANYICIERNKTSKEEYLKKIGLVKPFLKISSVDASDIYSAYDAAWKDFEDGVQYFSAKRAGCDYIVTRNVKDFDDSDVSVLTPDDMVDILYQKRLERLNNID